MKFPVRWYIFIFPELVHFYFPIDSFPKTGLDMATIIR